MIALQLVCGGVVQIGGAHTMALTVCGLSTVALVLSVRVSVCSYLRGWVDAMELDRVNCRVGDCDALLIMVDEI